MPVTDEITALLHLLHGGVAASLLRRLLHQFGSAQAARAAGPAAWISHGLTPEQCHALQQPPATEVAASLRWLEAPDHHVVSSADPLYPALLKRIASPPAALFVAGDPLLLWRPALAIVGSRAATAGGCANAALFAQALAREGFCIASGLAAGIDAAAHQAALDVGGMTLAVIASGPDVVYPPRHAALQSRIAAAGAVVSEHMPGTRPLKQFFPSRNRILAGLSLGTLVVEAAEKSGALITARQAVDAGREVFALPGSIHNPMARGCHRLLREGAALVETPGEVSELLMPQARDLAQALRGAVGIQQEGKQAPLATAAAQPQEDSNRNKLWLALGHDPSCMDELVARSGLTAAEVSSMLLTLELEGRVAAAYGRYSRIGG